MDEELFQPLPDVISPTELRLILERLHEVEPSTVPSIPEDHCRIQDIVEVTGYDARRIGELLREVRRREKASHVAEILTEMEESTHRVERPQSGQYLDPLSRHKQGLNIQLGKSILDDLPHNVSLTVEVKSAAQPTSLSGRIILAIVAFGVLGGFAFLLGILHATGKI